MGVEGGRPPHTALHRPTAQPPHCPIAPLPLTPRAPNAQDNIKCRGQFERSPVLPLDLYLLIERTFYGDMDEVGAAAGAGVGGLGLPC